MSSCATAATSASTVSSSVFLALDEFDGDILYGPEIISRGFVYMREHEDLIKRAQEVVLQRREEACATERARGPHQGRTGRFHLPGTWPSPNGASARHGSIEGAAVSRPARMRTSVRLERSNCIGNVPLAAVRTSSGGRNHACDVSQP